MKFLDNRIPPPVLVLLFGAVMWGPAMLPPPLPIGRGPRIAIGLAVTALGLFVLASAFLAFRKARTTIDPVNIHRASSLVTAGIFRLSRNPMYVGFASMLLGWAIALGGAWALVGPAVFVLYITRFQIAPEERVMRERFGAAYAAYCTRTRRWL